MKSLAIKLLTLSSFSLLIAGQMLPVRAASKVIKNDKKNANYELKESDKLSGSTRTAVITVAFFISGAGVLLGTGKSLKLEREEELAKENSN